MESGSSIIMDAEKVRINTPDELDVGIGICGWLLTGLSWIIVIVTLPFSLFVCFKVVQEYERAVIFRLGRLLQGGSKGPGIFFVLPCIENYQKVDLRTITLDVPPQEVLTKDSVTVSVDAVVYYRVSNATVSVANVENAHHSTRLLAQTTLRNILGTKNLHEILSDRESISMSMQAALDEATEPWGIKVERVEIKDARLPEQLQRAMAAEAEASREARAKVIAADGEKRASKALREASIIIEQSPSALQLRYLQTLNSIAAEKNSTIIFPVPIDFISHPISGNDTKESTYYRDQQDGLLYSRWPNNNIIDSGTSNSRRSNLIICKRITSSTTLSTATSMRTTLSLMSWAFKTVTSLHPSDLLPLDSSERDTPLPKS
ncbi:STOM [Lepeophtheirus salmonis]|uniref:STOM n=1 Tax=Lepeophtheirus salmonis TaxID=72036 RepID=A0A7R8CIZ7_LEPSM|nr:STOM [Lepeophtheirus salmonis]CAF2806200.1 STOM [Lepeophtheirus salmonis]